MDYLWMGFGALVIVFLLVIILGLEMQINTIARRTEKKIDSLG